MDCNPPVYVKTVRTEEKALQTIRKSKVINITQWMLAKAAFKAGSLLLTEKASPVLCPRLFKSSGRSEWIKQ